VVLDLLLIIDKMEKYNPRTPQILRQSERESSKKSYSEPQNQEDIVIETSLMPVIMGSHLILNESYLRRVR